MGVSGRHVRLAITAAMTATHTAAQAASAPPTAVPVRRGAGPRAVRGPGSRGRRTRGNGPLPLIACWPSCGNAACGRPDSRALSLVGGLLRKATAPAPVSGPVSWQPVRGPARHTGASGDRLGRRPAGGVSRTATQYQRRQARIAASSRALLARYHVGPGPRPGQPAGVSHPTVAQVRTDLQAISRAERNWSDKGWRLAVAAGVPGRLGRWQVPIRPPRSPVWTTVPFALGYGRRAHGGSCIRTGLPVLAEHPRLRNTFSNALRALFGVLLGQKLIMSGIVRFTPRGPRLGPACSRRGPARTAMARADSPELVRCRASQAVPEVGERPACRLP
jgi:hypothetical protein